MNLAPTLPIAIAAIPAVIGAATPIPRTDWFSRFGASYILTMSVVTILQIAINISILSFKIKLSDTLGLEVPLLHFQIFHLPPVLIIFGIYTYGALPIRSSGLRVPLGAALVICAISIAIHASLVTQMYTLYENPV